MNPMTLLTAIPKPAIDSSDDDDVPISQTLALEARSLAMLATLASQPTPSRVPRQKKAKPPSWHYETVAEPTGASSKYWDAAAPSERATKKRAKEKLSAIHETHERNNHTSSRRCNAEHPVKIPFYVCNTNVEIWTE